MALYLPPQNLFFIFGHMTNTYKTAEEWWHTMLFDASLSEQNLLLNTSFGFCARIQLKLRNS